MMKKLLMVLAFVSLLVTACSSSPGSYENVSAGQLNMMMQEEDVFLVDVHVPEQEHIEGTDVLIPYDEIGEHRDELPEDKKIVLYCRSDSMSTQASEKLAELGYDNVYNLIGGANAWKAAGYPLEDDGR